MKKKTENKEKDENEQDEFEEESEEESEDEEDEKSEEELEEIVNNELSQSTQRYSRTSQVNPSLEISTSQLETSTAAIPITNPANENTENQFANSSSYSIGSGSYMSNNYQSSNYDSSIYPKMIERNDSVNPFLDTNSSIQQQNLSSQRFFKSSDQLASNQYPNESDVRKYQPSQEQKRSKKKY